MLCPCPFRYLCSWVKHILWLLHNLDDDDLLRHGSESSLLPSAVIGFDGFDPINIRLVLVLALNEQL